MKKKTVHLLSILLVLVMLFGMLPAGVVAHAADIETAGGEDGTEYRDDSPAADRAVSGGTDGSAPGAPAPAKTAPASEPGKASGLQGDAATSGDKDAAADDGEADAGLCTLRFETNGGAVLEPLKVKKGACAPEPESPVREGYCFDGWYADEALETAFDFTVPVTGDLTLYAGWTQTGDEPGEKNEDADKEKDQGEDGDKDKDPPESPAFSASVTLDGVTVGVSAAAGVFPAGARLSVARVPVAAQREVDEAVEKERDDGANVAVSYTFDIKVLDADGAELRPADEQSVKVSFALAAAKDENLAAQVYHISDEGEAKALDTSTSGRTVTAVTDGFSYYVVEFTYGALRFVLPGGTEVKLAEILEKVGLSGEVSAAQSSRAELFSVSDESGEWVVRSHRAFSTEEWLKVVIGGVEYQITVTDEAGIKDTDVAAIGTVGYATLQAAVDAAAADDELRLLKDVTENVVLTDKTLTLDLGGFTVSGGGSGSTLTVSGGAVAVKNGVVCDALASVTGGGVHVKDAAAVTLSGLTIQNNQSTNGSDSASGGGVCLEAGTKAELTDCVITGNTVKGGGIRRYSYGAGVYVGEGAEVTLTGCTVSANSCATGGSYINTYGAGLCLMAGAKARLDGCTVSENTCPTTSGRGGGLYISAGASAELNGCTVSRNSINSKYGGAAYTEGSLSLSGGSVTDNVSSSSGRPGAIFCDEDAVINANGVVFSGHVRSAINADAGGTKTVRLSNCTFSSPQNTNLAQVELNGRVEAEIDGCGFTSGGPALSTNAMWGNTIGLTVKNSSFTGNVAASASVVEVGMYTTAAFNNCNFSNNRSRNGSVLSLDEECSSVTLSSCVVSGNVLEASSTVIARSRLNLVDTVISDNTARYVGGVQITRGGTVEMTGSVVKNNVATGVTNNNTSDSEGSAGGIAVSSYMGSGSLIFHSGAIYDNELLSARTGEGRANDVFVQGKSPNTGGRTASITVDIPASQMSDGSADFSARKWKDEHGVDYEDKPAERSDDHRYYTIMEEIDEYVAQVGEQQFKTIREAIEAASPGDRVYLIAERQVVSTEPITVDRDLEFDLCSRRLRLSSLGLGSAVLTVSGGAKLRLTNSEDPDYTDGGVVRGSTVIGDGCSLTVADVMAVTPFIHGGDALVLEKRLDQAVEVTLGDGRHVTLGDDWKNDVNFKTQGLKLSLSAADLAAVNAGGAADHRIVENGDEALLRIVTAEGVTNQRVRKLFRDGDIFLHQDKGVYLASSGSNAAGYGFDPAKPVQTFDRALELLQSDPGLDGIYIVGVVYPKAGEIWEMPEGETRPVYRYKGFTTSTNHDRDYMIYMSNGDFTLRNIILDGNKAQMPPVTSMIKVHTGTLYIESGAELRNNNAAKPDVPYDGQHVVHGGAVLCESVSGRIVMNGGWIHDNEAFMGGGIFAGNGYYNGGGQKFIMNGGVIENNRAVYYDELSRKFNNNANATGGGVMLAFGAYMDMNGGSIRGNIADNWGGGVCMGNNNDYYSEPGAYETYQQRRVTFNMYGGDISGNTAGNGGGLFVQCWTHANLHGGSISGNTATESTNQPRGGGVYVNGRHGRGGIDDGILTIHEAVEMTGNTAAYQGHAIMTCATSLTFVRDILGAAIHDNGTDGVQVAFTSQSGSTQGGVPMRLHSYLSELMPGGGDYGWVTGAGVPAGRDRLCDVVEPIGVTSAKTAGTPEMDAALGLVRVRINNNRSSSGGGAIGNNGSVFIGRYLVREDVHVSKEWDDGGNASGDRPASVTVVLTRGEGADREDLLEAELTASGTGGWEHTFTGLQRYKLDPATGLETDEEIVYGVREKEPVSSDKAYYTVTVTEGASTERAADPSVDPAAPTDPVKVRSFTVKNTRVAKVSLIYDPNGGVGDMSAQSYVGPLRPDLKAEANRYNWDGYRFTGWNTAPDASGTAYQPGGTIVFTQPEMVLYAQWEPVPVPYKVMFYYQVNGAYPTTPDDVQDRSGQAGTEVSVTAEDKIPARDGYVLDASRDSAYTATLSSDGSTVLRVCFKQQFTVIYAPGAHGTWDPERETTPGLDYGVVTPGFSGDLGTEHEPGWVFVGWDKVISGTVTESVTYTALWKRQEGPAAIYTVEFYYEKEGAYPATPDEISVRSGKPGETVRVTEQDKVTARERCFFDESAANVLQGLVKEDGSLVLKVHFKRLYLIIHDPNGGTMNGSPDPVRELYGYGEVIRIKDKPERQGYTFLYWRGSRYDPGQSYTVTEDHTFIAQWKYDPGSPVSPKTGDGSGLALWTALLLFSAAGLAAGAARVVRGKRSRG